MANNAKIKDSTASWLAYIGAFVTGIIVLLFSQSKSKQVKTHAWQSILLSVAVAILFMVFSLFTDMAVVGGFMTLLKWFTTTLWVVLTLMCITSVLNETVMKIPGLYKLAEKCAGY